MEFVKLGGMLDDTLDARGLGDGNDEKFVTQKVVIQKPKKSHAIIYPVQWTQSTQTCIYV